MTRSRTLTIEETRKRIAALPEDERCSPGCKGWDVFETNTDRGIEVERCDECFAHLPDDRKVWDDDVQQLPEAIATLAEVMRGDEMYSVPEGHGPGGDHG